MEDELNDFLVFWKLRFCQIYFHAGWMSRFLDKTKVLSTCMYIWFIYIYIYFFCIWREIYTYIYILYIYMWIQYVATMKIPKNLPLCSFFPKSTAQTSRSLVVYIVWFTVVGANLPTWPFKALYRFKEEHDWLHAAKTNIMQKIWILRLLSEIKHGCVNLNNFFSKKWRSSGKTNQPTSQPTNQPTSEPAPF